MEAAVRLVEAVDGVHGVGSDPPLDEFAAAVANCHAERGERMAREAGRPDRSMPGDRTFV